MSEQANYQLIKEAFVQIEILVEQVHDLYRDVHKIQTFLEHHFDEFEVDGEEE